MKETIDIVPYCEENCICLEYVPGADIRLETGHNALSIRANAEGLQFLAKVCLTLVQGDVPQGSHIHLDGFDFVRANDVDLTMERCDP